MNGRQENNLKYEQKIKSYLIDAPQILDDYYYSLDTKTEVTKEQYIRHVKAFLNKYENNYIDLKPTDINKYLDKFKYKKCKDGIKEASPSVRYGILAALNSFYEFLLDNEYVDKNPCSRIKRPNITNQKKEIVSLELDEIEYIKKNIEHAKDNNKYVNELLITRDLAIFIIGCTTGLRVTAITEINVEDVNMEEMYIEVIEKGNKYRKIYFGDTVRMTLEDWLIDRKYLLEGYEDTNALFISQYRQRIRTNTIRYVLKKYTEGLDKKITPHKMRSTCATLLYENTRDIYLTQNVLGHSSVETTKRYAKMSENRLKDAANVMNDLI